MEDNETLYARPLDKDIAEVPSAEATSVQVEEEQTDYPQDFLEKFLDEISDIWTRTINPEDGLPPAPPQKASWRAHTPPDGVSKRRYHAGWILDGTRFTLHHLAKYSLDKKFRPIPDLKTPE